MSISIQRFAPTPAAKLGLVLDLAVVAASTMAATHASWPIRIVWALCAMGVFWSTSSVARHYAYSVERAVWEDLVLTLLILLSVATVLGLGGAAASSAHAGPGVDARRRAAAAVAAPGHGVRLRPCAHAAAAADADRRNWPAGADHR